MTRKLGLGSAILIAGPALLASCLVTQDKLKFYSITLPAKWPTYVDGHYIDFIYDIFLVRGVPQPTAGSIRWSWEQSYQLLPFTGNTLTPVMRFTVAERLGDGEKKSIQYTTQDGTGSMFLHATEGIGSTATMVRQNSYWAHNAITLTNPATPISQQLFWSPINDGSSVNIIGENMAPTEWHLVGPCETANCPHAATLNFTELRINQPTNDPSAIEEIETPIGKFEAYRFDYSGSVTIAAGLQQVPPFFDYRMSCWTAGEQGVIYFNGSIWIYPPIGPVKLDNGCIFKSDQTYYSARVSKTNLSYK